MESFGRDDGRGSSEEWCGLFLSSSSGCSRYSNERPSLRLKTRGTDIQTGRRAESEESEESEAGRPGSWGSGGQRHGDRNERMVDVTPYSIDKRSEMRQPLTGLGAVSPIPVTWYAEKKLSGPMGREFFGSQAIVSYGVGCCSPSHAVRGVDPIRAPFKCGRDGLPRPSLVVLKAVPGRLTGHHWSSSRPSLAR